MLEFIFTLDYEIFGDGSGNIKKCVINPTEAILKVFKEHEYHFVIFPEVLEFEKIVAYRSDPNIGMVKFQLQEILRNGNEIGLHIHSWWIDARWQNDKWQFDYKHANLCRLPANKIIEIISKALVTLRGLLDNSRYQPISFRNGFWIMQPSNEIAKILRSFNIEIDTTLFKGGRIREYGVDYRPSLKNGYYWRFTEDVNRHQDDGLLLEIPIYTELVPFWKMYSRVFNRLPVKEYERDQTRRQHNIIKSGRRISDFFRFKYPRKLDYCFMDTEDILATIRKLMILDKKTMSAYKPIVLIGHTKNLPDIKKIENILNFLRKQGLRVVTFREALRRISNLADNQ